MFCPLCNKMAVSESGLRKHLTGTGAYGGHDETPQAAAELARRAAASSAPLPARSGLVRRRAADGSGRPGSNVVRAGHMDTVAYMATPQFKEVVKLFDAWQEIGGAYFRPTDNGVRAVDLSATSLKPRIGIGDAALSLIRRGTSAAALTATMATRITYLREVRARQTSASLENQFEARLIREAQSAGLVLSGFPSVLRFVHSQWRIDTPEGAPQEFCDLLAVDLSTRKLVVVELKCRPDASAANQALRYASYFKANAVDLVPFFEQVARMMGTLYGCLDLTQMRLEGVAADALVAWPLGSTVHVERVQGAA